MFHIQRYGEETKKEETAGGSHHRKRLEALKVKAEEARRQKQKSTPVADQTQTTTKGGGPPPSSKTNGDQETATTERKVGPTRHNEEEMKAEKKKEKKENKKRQRESVNHGDNITDETGGKKKSPVAPFAEFAKVPRTVQEDQTVAKSSDEEGDSDGDGVQTVKNKPSKKKKKKNKGSKKIATTLWKILVEPNPVTHNEETRDDPATHQNAAANIRVSTSLKDVGAASGINELILNNLTRQGITNLFPIQQNAIPKIMKADSVDTFGLGDICISAPTGSGKTLVYVIPIVQALLSRAIPRLRALVVVPTHELVNQVAQTFNSCSAGSDLRVVAMTADTPFLQQQEILQESDAGLIDEQKLAKTGVDILVSTPGRLVDHLDSTPGFTLEHLQFLVVDEADRLLYQSYQDWVRRIHQAVYNAPHPSIDYLSGKASLEKLKTVSSSKVMGSSYKEVLKKGQFPLFEFESTRAYTKLKELLDPNSEKLHQFDNPAYSSNAANKPRTMRPRPEITLDGIRMADACVAGGLGGSVPSLSHFTTSVDSMDERMWNQNSDWPSVCYSPFRKIICSATLTKNPQKLAALQLRHPVYFDVHGNREFSTADSGVAGEAISRMEGNTLYATPTGLLQAYVVCKPEQKPLALIYLLQQLESLRSRSDGLFLGQALVFTSSVDTTHRLTRLLQLLQPTTRRIAEFSSNMSQAYRREIMDGLHKGEIAAVICSDAAARGLDFPDLTSVIQYDVAVHGRQYIHRVGRTARAGRLGVTYSLLRANQVRHFRQLIRANLHDRGASIKKEIITEEEINSIQRKYADMLPQLKSVLDAEKKGQLHKTEEIVQDEDGGSIDHIHDQESTLYE